MYNVKQAWGQVHLKVLKSTSTWEFCLVQVHTSTLAKIIK